MEKDAVANYYSRPEVAEELVRFSKFREVGARYESGAYAKRPTILFYPSDVKRLVQEGVVSFHTSVEHWQNPATLDKRVGWDFLIDLDSESLELTRRVAEALVELLNAHGVGSVYMKFSGRAGFHIFVPWKAFDPILVDRFPDIPRAIGLYLEDYIKNDKEVLTKEERFGVKIDSIAISSRHLMRAPYSINEKSGLASIPVSDPWFDIEQAKIENVKVKPFLMEAHKGEAMNLVDLSLEFVKKQEIPHTPTAERVEVTGKVPEELFAPCIKKILEGLSDGRKRGEFILRTYMSHLGWNWEEIEAFLMEWNKKNKPPMKDGYIKGHIRWNKRQKTKTLPPNHDRDGFYKDMGIWTDECAQNKNPLGYTLKRYKMYLQQKKEEEKAEKKKQKGKEKERETPSENPGS